MISWLNKLTSFFSLAKRNQVSSEQESRFMISYPFSEKSPPPKQAQKNERKPDAERIEGMFQSGGPDSGICFPDEAK